MKIEINIEKHNFYFLLVFIAALFVVGVSAFTSTSTNVGHEPSEVGPGTFGGNSGSLHGFPGNLNITNNLFFPSNQKGIFWGTAENYAIPHINYDSSNGLWISTGTTGKNINVEGGDLTAGNVIVNDTITTKNINVTRNATIANKLTAGSADIANKLTAGSADIAGRLTADSAGIANKLTAGNATISDKIQTTDLRATGNITLGGKARDTWPISASSSNCPSGNFTIGLNSTGKVVCKAVPNCRIDYTACQNSGYAGCGYPTENCPSGYVATGIYGGDGNPSGCPSDADRFGLVCCKLTCT